MRFRRHVHCYLLSIVSSRSVMCFVPAGVTLFLQGERDRRKTGENKTLTDTMLGAAVLLYVLIRLTEDGTAAAAAAAGDAR